MVVIAGGRDNGHVCATYFNWMLILPSIELPVETECYIYTDLQTIEIEI